MRKLILSIVVSAILVGPMMVETVDAQSWRTMTSARQVSGDDPLDVNVRYGAGMLEISPAEAPLLYKVEVRYDGEKFEPIVEFDEEDTHLRVGVETRGRVTSGDHDGSAATLQLARDIPLDLDLEFGAGRAELDLSGISLQRLEVSTGASETRIRFDAPNPIAAEAISIEAGAAQLTVTGLGNAGAERISFKGGLGETVLDFSGAWSRNVEASVEMGIGSLTFRIPRELGVRVARRSFLTSFDAPGMERRDDGYYSVGWNEASHRLDVQVSAALGSISIVWID